MKTLEFVKGFAVDSEGRQLMRLPGSDADNNINKFEIGSYNHEEVAVSQTDQPLGFEGAAGDFLHRLVVTVATAATGTVSIKDGSGSAIPITVANTPIGVYSVELNVPSATGGWSVTTGAGATVMAIGRFS